MRRSLYSSVLLLLGTFLPQTAQAQVIWGREEGRYFSPGTYVPHDGAPYSHRQFYGTGSFLYLNGDSRQAYLLDYADKMTRAYKFGYKPPPDPYLRPIPEALPPVREVIETVGGEPGLIDPNLAEPKAPAPPRTGLGIFRRR